jgi:predicted glycoside hydrolase/deacetylase ChbG (UPF0249 family)
VTGAAPPERRRIAVCADDFGLTRAANVAILELGKLGAISATSVAVDGPVLGEDITALRSLRDRISVGLHLNLTENPRFPRLRGVKSWILATWLRRIDPGLLAREIDLQLERFETLLDGHPTHVDGHEHVHQFPGVREPLLEAIARRYGRSTALRCTWPREYRGPKAAVIGLLGSRALRRGIANHDLRCNSDFAGVYDLASTAGFESRMDGWLATLHDGGLIMCHPESMDRNASPARQHEYQFFRSTEWPLLLKNRNVELVRPDRS